MGTPEFAVASLERLLQAGYEVVGVVTAPDRPAGRGRQLRQSAVKAYALEKGLPILQPEKLKSEDFLQALRALKADLQVVVAFRMMPREVWDMPGYGTFNLHASLLPDYRGAAPINRVLMAGETATGVTTFFIDDQIDTGAILFQRETPVGPDETAGELHDRLMDMGAELVVETANRIADGTAIPRAQPGRAGLHTAPKIDKAGCRVNWDRPLDEIYNHIRGLSPYPAAWALLKNGAETQEVKLFRVAPVKEAHSFPPGKLFWDKAGMKVAVPGGYIRFLEIQLAGKRRLEIKEVLNGLNLAENAQMA